MKKEPLFTFELECQCGNCDIEITDEMKVQAERMSKFLFNNIISPPGNDTVH